MKKFPILLSCIFLLSACSYNDSSQTSVASTKQQQKDQKDDCNQSECNCSQNCSCTSKCPCKSN